MTPLLGRCRLTITSFLSVQHHSSTNISYSQSSKVIKTTVPDYEINEQILLSKENRQSCLEKMCCSPPVGIRQRGVKQESKFAAVLIAICTDENQNLSILYTRRSHLLSRHMRQISFPGGIKDDHEDYIQCALRETEEEIGLPSSRVEIWGSGNLITPPYTAAIMPVVGLIRNFKDCELKLNTAEVEEAFAIPVKKLVNPKNLKYTQFKSGYSSPVFVVDDKIVWGITGFLTNIFLKCFLPPEYNNLKNRVKYIRPFKSKSTS